MFWGSRQRLVGLEKAKDGIHAWRQRVTTVRLAGAKAVGLDVDRDGLTTRIRLPERDPVEVIPERHCLRRCEGHLIGDAEEPVAAPEQPEIEPGDGDVSVHSRRALVCDPDSAALR